MARIDSIKTDGYVYRPVKSIDKMLDKELGERLGQWGLFTSLE